MHGRCPVSASITWKVICWPRCSNPTRPRSRLWRSWSPVGTRCSPGWTAWAATISWDNTLDDAAGEAFDKTAKLLDLGYPGGPRLAALAERGRPGTFRFPRPLTERPGLDFSFSGLKTAVVVALRDRKLDDQTRADAALAFEEAVAETLAIKCERALEKTGVQTLVVAGGVGANRRLRARLLALGRQLGVRVAYPRPEFCTDNAAMIALLGCLRLGAGEHDDLAIRARARWPMSHLAPPATGRFQA